MDYIRPDRPNYSPGQPIDVAYGLSTTVGLYGAGQIVLFQNGVRFPVWTGPAVSTTDCSGSFQLLSTLASGTYSFAVRVLHQYNIFNQNMFTVSAASGWINIATTTSGMFTGSGQIYGYTAPGALARYVGDAANWMPIGTGIQAALCNDNGVFAITNLPAAGVSWYHEQTGAWTPILTAGCQQIAGNGAAMFALLQDGSVQSYDSVAGIWSSFGAPPSPAASITANNRFVFVLGTDNSIMQYQPGTGWVTIGANALQIAASDSALYALTNTAAIQRYLGAPNSWSVIGQAPAGAPIAAGGLSIAYLTPDGSQVWLYTGIGTQWQQVCGAAVDISLDAGLLVGSMPGGGGGLYIVDELAIPPSEVSAASAATEIGDPPIVTMCEWSWSFRTKDDWLAGFDGEVTVAFFSASGSLYTSFSLPYSHFERNKLYSFQKLLNARDPATIVIVGENNFFNEHWEVSTVTAWNSYTSSLFTFDIDGDIPLWNEPHALIPYTSKSTRIAAPVGVTIYIWPFATGLPSGGLVSAYGHASMSLSSGTHISWWPLGEANRVPLTSIRFLSDLYSAPAVQNMTLDSEIDLENHQPERITVAGLDEAAIETWWTSYMPDPANRWSSLSNNCSTVVYQALVAGGIRNLLSPAEQRQFLDQEIWTPQNILNVATYLKTKMQP